jgi:UPF0755 protein
VLCIALLGLAGFWYIVYSPLHFAADTRDFDIDSGSTLRAVSRRLHAENILADPWRFELVARWHGKAHAIKAGSYQLSPDWSLEQLFEALSGVAGRLDKVALIEGWTFRQARLALDAHPHLRHDTVGKSDLELARLLQLDVPHPEGLLFPDTYHFAKGSSDLAILQRAARRMRQILKEQWASRAADLPLKTPYEVLILASIIEKETGRAAERGMIAGVMINRLRRNMMLQTDPTVIYGLGEAFDGNLRRRDLVADTPYNTYMRHGLPPTPIAIPGRAAIAAAVMPEQTKALYFVARGDGSSEFSETLAEHNRAVTKYQRKQPGSP